MKNIILFLLLFVGIGAPAFAFDYRDFRQLPIVYEGRLMPLDSFARIYHRQVSVSADPVPFLAESLFAPQRVSSQPLLLVRNHDVRLLLSLQSQEKDLYSLVQIIPALAAVQDKVRVALDKDPKDLSALENDLLDLQERAAFVSQVTRAQSLLLPLAVGGGGNKSYLDLIRLEEKQNDPQVADHLALLQASGENNILFRILPPQWQGESEWLAPWALVRLGQGSPGNARYLDYWQRMAFAWIEQDQNAFAQAAKKARAHVQSLVAYEPARLTVEVWHNKLSMLGLAVVAYGLGLLVALGARGQRFLFPLIVTGFLFHAADLALRLFIQGRPPVGTLYESILFVSLVCAGLAIVFARFANQRIVLGCGAALGAGLLALSFWFAPQGDQLPVLTAVLNTNFWLATHVICITAGYGFSLLAGLGAHIWLFLRARGREVKIVPLHRLTLAALLFTAVGTILGGIWADQSWGRFWGWDPKENGALLIVLWLLWVLHGRYAGRLNEEAFVALLAMVTVIVALAWFGVNLLATGLHSYGFVSGIAFGLAVFCVVESLVIGLLWFAARRRHAR